MKYLILICILSFTVIAKADEFRTFTNLEGKTINARILQYDSNGERVQLKLKNHKKAWIKIDSLSPEDQAYIKSVIGKNPVESDTEKKIATEEKETTTLSTQDVRDIGKRYVEAWESGNLDELKKLYLYPDKITQSTFKRYRSYVFDEIEFDKIKYGHILLEVSFKKRPGGFDPDGSSHIRRLLLTPEGKIKYDDIFIKHPIAIAMISTSNIQGLSFIIHKQSGIQESKVYPTLIAKNKTNFNNLEKTGIPLFGLDLNNPYKDIEISLSKIESWIKKEGREFDNSDPQIFFPRGWINI